MNPVTGRRRWIPGLPSLKKEALPEHLAAEKSARDQIVMCFDSFENPTLPTLFD